MISIASPALRRQTTAPPVEAIIPLVRPYSMPSKMMASLPLFMEQDNQLMERVGVLYDQIESKDEISGTVTGVGPPVKASGAEKKVRSIKRKGKVINIKDFKRK